MMKNYRIPLLLFAALFASLCGYAQTTLFDFENSSAPDSWGSETAVVSNEWGNTVNSSSKCYEISFTETWGRISTNTTFNPSQTGLSVKVRMSALGDITAYVDNNDTYPGVSQAVLAENEWVQLYFDFSAVATSVGQIQIGTGSLNTIYVDDIKVLPLSSFPQSACSGEMDVDYSYGTVAIGGGGFVSGLIAHETDRNVKFARTDVGGAYKWNASDCSWKPLNNFISSDDKGLLSIEALAVDPQNSDNIYMLGGCMYFSGEKTAIMISRDGGESFSTVVVSDLIKAHGNGNGRGNGERLAVDPNNSNILYCGGRVGAPLIVSTDAGETWSEVSSFPSSAYSATTKWPVYDTWTTNPTMWPTTENLNGTSAVVFDPSSVSDGKTQRIFVGISRTGADNVYVSEDGGATWSAVSGLPTDLMPLRMKMDPAGNLLITYSDKEGPNNCGTTGGIYRYNPNTKNSENISPPGGFPIGDVSFAKNSADSLVCTTICTWVNQDWGTGNTVHGDIIFTSIDGGASWRSLQDNFQFDANGCTWIPDHAIHWSCSILIDPFNSNKVSVTSGNGIFTSNNVWCEAEGGPTFYFDVNGLEETVPLDLVSVPGGDLYSVIGDYTGFRHSDIHSFPPIHKPESHTTGGIAYAAGNPDIMARVAKEAYYTEDGGASWTKMSGATSVYDPSYSEVAISADGSTIVHLPSGGTLEYSTNKGSSFSASSGASGAGYVIADPVNADYFYAAGENAVYVSSDGGKSFATTSADNGEVTRLCVVPGKEGLIYLPKGGSGLAVSTDHGASFSTVPFVTRCDAVGVGKGKSADSYVIYIYGKANGCDHGIYRSEDEGASWQRINDASTQFGGVGNGAFIVGDQNTYGRFYLATVGLGIVYGEPSSSATATSWSCFVDETVCNADVKDCNGVLGGSAYYDDCGICVGGNTGKTECLEEQTIELVSGWNLISINVEPVDNSVEAIFSGLDLAVIKTFDDFWTDSQNAMFNSLETITPAEGYLVYMNKAGTLKVSGTPLEDYTRNPITDGWNIIGVPYQTATPFSTEFDSSNCEVIKDLNGNWKPEGNTNTIENFEPGKAYFVK